MMEYTLFDISHRADGGVGLTRPPQARVWKQAWVQIPVCPYLFPGLSGYRFIKLQLSWILIYSFDREPDI
jgi:hypothetical protein